MGVGLRFRLRFGGGCRRFFRGGGGGSRSGDHGRRQGHARRRDFYAIEACAIAVKACALLFFQRPRHAQVLFSLLLGLALARQQQQQKQQYEEGTTGNQPEQQRVAHDFVDDATWLAGGRCSFGGRHRFG